MSQMGRRVPICRRLRLCSSFTEWEPVMDQINHAATQHAPWNKGKLVGQKAPLKLKDIWAIRIRLQIGNRTRELALFNLAIDSKLRSCDLVKLRVRDVCHGSVVAARAIVMQQKSQRPVQFEITEQTRESLLAWIRAADRRSDDYLFPSRIHGAGKYGAVPGHRGRRCAGDGRTDGGINRDAGWRLSNAGANRPVVAVRSSKSTT